MRDSGARILLIEHDPRVRRSLRALLMDQHFRVVEAGSAAEGAQRAREYVPDVVLLDIPLPDHDGLWVVRGLRQWSQTPVIVLSARGDEHDKVSLLDAGADDYVNKPFGANELLARIRVSLRQVSLRMPSHGSLVALGETHIDLARRMIIRADEELHLTPHEYKLLEGLLRHADRVVTHQQLQREVWGIARTETRSLRVLVAALRQKLEPTPARPQWLITETGVGYRLRMANRFTS